MKITVNGEARDMPAGSTIADLIQIIAVEPRYVAVERNRELVPRNRHGQEQLEDGDELEIVTLVGGGSWTDGYGRGSR